MISIRTIILILCIFSLPFWASASESNPDSTNINVNVIESSQNTLHLNPKPNGINRKFDDRKPISKKKPATIKQRLKNKLKFFKKNPNTDWETWFYLISMIVSIIGGLIALGSSAWLVIAVLLGMLIYLGFVFALFFMYIDNGFELEWGWWFALFGLTGLGIWGTLFFVGLNAVSSAIIGFMLYFAFGLVAVAIVVMLFIAFFKAIFAPFRIFKK